MEKFIEELNKKEVFFTKDLHRSDREVRFSIYTEPDREIWDFCLYHQHNHSTLTIKNFTEFNEKRSHVFLYAGEIIEEFLKDEWKKSETNFFTFNDIDAYPFFEKERIPLTDQESKKISRVRKMDFYIEKSTGIFPSLFTLFTDFTEALKKLQEKFPSSFFHCDRYSFSISFDIFHNGIDATYSKVFVNEDRWHIQLDKFHVTTEPVPFSETNLERIEQEVEKFLDKLYKKQRLQILFDPPKRNFNSWMRKLIKATEFDNSVYAFLSEKMSPLEIEEFSFKMKNISKDEFTYLRMHTSHDWTGLFSYENIHFIMQKKELTNDSPAHFHSFDSKTEALSFYQELILNEVIKKHA